MFAIIAKAPHLSPYGFQIHRSETDPKQAALDILHDESLPEGATIKIYGAPGRHLHKLYRVAPEHTRGGRPRYSGKLTVITC